MISSNRKNIFAITCHTILFCLLLLSPGNALCQKDNPAARKIVFGTIMAPPLYMKTTDGQWEGFSIEVWQGVAQQLGVLSEFRQCDGLEPLLAAIQTGEIDVIPSLPAEPRYEVDMDLCHSYYKSGLAIAVPAEGSGGKWKQVIGKIFSTDIMMAFGLLLLMCLTAGAIICFLKCGGTGKCLVQGL